MNKVFKKNKCRYSSTGLHKRFQNNRFNDKWWEEIVNALNSHPDDCSNFKSEYLCDWKPDPLLMEVEDCIMKFYKETDHLKGHEYMMKYKVFIRGMRDKYGEDLVSEAKKSLSGKHW